MQLLDFGVEPLVLLLLPLGGRSVAEEDPAAKRADRMHTAEHADLQRAAAYLFLRFYLPEDRERVIWCVGRFRRFEIPLTPTLYRSIERGSQRADIR